MKQTMILRIKLISNLEEINQVNAEEIKEAKEQMSKNEEVNNNFKKINTFNYVPIKALIKNSEEFSDALSSQQRTLEGKYCF